MRKCVDYWNYVQPLLYPGLAKEVTNRKTIKPKKIKLESVSLSDKQGKRQPFLLLAFLGAIPGLLGLTFAASAALLYPSAVLLGFFLVSALPIGMQYSAEITYPTPEGTSNGLIQLFGQGAVVFVYIMEAMKTSGGSFTPSLVLALILLVVSAGLATQMKDPQPE